MLLCPPHSLTLPVVDFRRKTHWEFTIHTYRRTPPLPPENSQFTLAEEETTKKRTPLQTHTQNSHLQKKKKKTLPTPNPKRTPSPISKRSTVRVCSTDPFIGIDELRWFDVVVWLQPGPGLETHELQTCTQALHTSTIQENSSTPYYAIVIYPTKRQITRVNNRKRFSQL